MNTRTRITLALGLLATLTLGACTKNAATGRNILTLGISREEEIQIGASAMPGMVSQMGGKVKDTSLQGYVVNVGQALAARTDDRARSMPWEFTLLNTDDINAFALPGGKVFIAKGLAKRLTNEAQLAAVLGHEIGHVAAQHTAERIGQSTAFSVGTQVTAQVLSRGSASTQQYGGLALQLGNTLIPLKFSRDQESEADNLGMRYMTELNYDPVGALQVMQILAEASQSRTPELFSTHPNPETRIQRIGAALSSTYSSTHNNPAYTLREEPFRSQFLKKLAQLDATDDGDSLRDRFALANPATWCAHCADH